MLLSTAALPERTLMPMDVKERALFLDCPVCGAKPREGCHRIDGRPMTEPHSDRRNLVMGIRPIDNQQEVSQIEGRIDRSRPKDSDD